MLTVTVNTAAFEAKIALLTNAIQNDSVKQVADTYIEELPKLYEKGIAGDGEPLPDYNAKYAQRLGIPRSPKTLKRDKGRLHELHLEGNIVTVPSDMQDIALGQQTGHSRQWGYSNIMFEQNSAIESTAAHNLAEYITERISL